MINLVKNSYPLQLHIGSGKDFKHDFLNVDINDYWKPDIIADLNVPFPQDEVALFETRRFGLIEVRKNTFKRIVANQVLEHIQNLTTAMKSFLELLEMEGELEVSVPYDLSYGAWQDPTHVRAFNENSWKYYTEWFWYLGWREARFEMVKLEFKIDNPFGMELMKKGVDQQQILRTPRAIDEMCVELKKVPLTEYDKSILQYHTSPANRL